MSESNNAKKWQLDWEKMMSSMLLYVLICLATCFGYSVRCWGSYPFIGHLVFLSLSPVFVPIMIGTALGDHFEREDNE